MSQQSVTVINTLTPKPGRFEDFVAAQVAGVAAMHGRVPGFRSGRIYRAQDGKNLVQISVFDSREQLERFLKSELFTGHRDRVAPLLDTAAPNYYQLAYDSAADAVAGALAA